MLAVPHHLAPLLFQAIFQMPSFYGLTGDGFQQGENNWVGFGYSHPFH
jgi:hypothetical protein